MPPFHPGAYVGSVVAAGVVEVIWSSHNGEDYKTSWWLFQAT
jgi:hypothetical protein